MLKDKKIALIGSGNMGEALISGLISNETTQPKNITCADLDQQKLDIIKKKYSVKITTDNVEAVEKADIIIYAVKPQVLEKVLRQTGSKLNMRKLVISVAAGVPMAAIESCMKKELRLIRVMPNIAAFVKQSATAISTGKHATRKDIDTALEIFNSVGECICIRENNLMDAITGLSGSGPAYVFTIVDAMADAGVKMGIPREDALSLSIQTILGAATLLKETKAHPGELKDKVTSPGGTSISGLHALEQGGIRTTIMNAVEAATNRSAEIGENILKNFKDLNIIQLI